MDNTIRWFRQGLGTRIDALDVALKALEQNEADAPSTIRQFAQSLVAPATRHGFTRIAKAASAIVAKPDSLLSGAAQDLIRLLREEAARAKRSSACVLIIGNDPGNAQLLQRLATSDREVLVVATAAEAQTVLRDKVVVFILLNLFLPDVDGRTMITRLRENPLTASIPLLVLAKRMPDDIARDSLLGPESFMQTPVDTDEVVARVGARLRRARESMKEAHRDPLTGLLNRAAFREHAARVLEACSTSGEPLSFAVVSVDGAATLRDEYGQAMVDEVVQRIAAVMSGSLRATDSLARWGNYEFACIFPGEDQFGGSRAVDKVREKVQKETFQTADGAVFQVTFSAGISISAEGAALDNVAADADRYLYQAMSSGGNRVISNQSQVPHRTERILMLLSDRVTARVLTHLFSREGFEVASLPDATQGMAAAAGRQRFHLIVLDEQLPDRGGFEVLQELRHMPRNNRVPIVMLISRNSPDSIVRALELGASDYVIMPLSPLSFMTHMRRLMKHTSPESPQARRFLRVLIADDDVRALLLGASALHERGGFQVFLARGADDAVQRLAQDHPDVVVAPCHLKSGAGQDAFLRLVEAARAERVKVLAASDQADDPKLAGSGALAGWLQHPYNPLKFGEDIESVLGVAHNSLRPQRAIEHLNAEIQRVIRLK